MNEQGVEARLADHHVETEIDSQPPCWREATARLPAVRDALPRDGERVAVFGCGASLSMTRAYAALREAKGLGVTDAVAASEPPLVRRAYDRHIAISRAGTTPEVLDAVERPADAHARARGTDPDRPRSLTRSVVLP